MSVAQRRAKGASPTEPSLSNLSISNKASGKKAAPVADSWEDEAESDGSEPTTPTAPASSAQSHPNAPPPTPASPSAAFQNPYALPDEIPGVSGRERDRGDVRPDKTTATASRMIAGALGVKAPRKGEEMRRYEQAAAEKEKARRDKEKAEREEEERRKRNVWED